VKHAIYIILFFILPFFASAGNNDKEKASLKSVSGKVAATSGAEVPAVQITIKETNEIFYTDMSGNFQFQVKSDKVYSVVVESIGYAPVELKSTELHRFSEIILKEF
jgi:hypothetical protein